MSQLAGTPVLILKEGYTFEEAIEFLFKCPTCHKPMTHLDNNHIIEALTQKIEQIERELTE